MARKWKDILWAEPLEPKKLTPEEAARKCARLLYEAAQQNCMIGFVLGSMSKISENVGRYLKKDSTPYRQIWQGWFLDLVEFLLYVLEKEAPETRKAIYDIDPTVFMWSWAVQAAIGALKEDGYYDEPTMWPKRGHLVQKGSCPRCHLPIEKSDEK
jgi:hypothetical protein